MSARRRDAGFSLMELLVSMSLLAMIGVLAAGGVRFGAAAWERSTDVADAAIETRNTQKFLARLITSAEPVRARGARSASGTVEEPPVLFDGRPGRLEMIAVLPSHLAPDRLHLVELSAQDGDLRLRWTQVGDRRPALSDRSASETLLSGVDALTLRYFGPGTTSRTPRWHDSWESRERLPDLIEVTVRFGDDDARPFAPVVARPLNEEPS